MSGPQIAAALSRAQDTQVALTEVGDSVAAIGKDVDLCFVFFSAEHRPQADQIGAALQQRWPSAKILGCSGESIVGVGTEVEEGPALSLWCARLPGVTLTTLQLGFETTPDGGMVTGWPDEPIVMDEDGATMILLGEPFSFPTDALLERLRADYPQLPVVGGMSSGAPTPGENQLLLGNHVLTEGAVAVILRGDIGVRTVLSQGCRPIGSPMVITAAERNEIQQLAGEPAVLKLKEIFDTLPDREQQLVQNGLHVGRVISEYQDSFDAGDFLVRNVVGLDPQSGSVVIGDYVRPGQTVQFHIRDEQSADSELKRLISDAREDGQTTLGGLLFTCNGRGTRLFSRPDHDAAVLGDYYGDVPLAGFFAQGEIGPIGGQNFVHGFTASFVLFETKRAK